MHRRLGFVTFMSPPPVPSPPPSGQLQSEGHHKDLTLSIIIIFTIVLIVFIVSALLHLLLKFITKHCHRSDRTANQSNQEEENTAENIIPRVVSSRRVVPEDPRLALVEALPLFTFDSIKGLKSSNTADCAVCLSKFEPHDKLRLLPICCHAFHSECVDTWLISNLTCPLCRSSVDLEKSDGYLKLFTRPLDGNPNGSGREVVSDGGGGRRNSFRVEIGSVSRRRDNVSDSGYDNSRSVSMGSFRYSFQDDAEVNIPMSVVVVGPTHHHHQLDLSDSVPEPQPPGDDVAAEVGSRVPWLKDYVDKLSSASSSFRFSGCRSSGVVSTGSSRRTTEAICINGGSWDLEGNEYSNEINNFILWLSGV